jgi:hypothetical protein
MHKARLIPISGIGSDSEAERRASSAFLAVLTVVRDLSIELFAPLGASRARRATVEAFTEVEYEHEGRRLRPDGLVRVSYGQASWTALVEVKTREATLDADQINAYWDIARAERFDHVLTISNEISPVPGEHPTPGLRVRSNSPVQVSHLSWTAILTTATRIKQHRGVDDPEQAWILQELIRYLEHPASGALAFEDMGPQWVSVRDGARQGTLVRRDNAVLDIAGRFEQLIRFAALVLASQIGDAVTPILSRSQRDNPAARVGALADALASDGTLEGSLRVANTAGPIAIAADLRAQQLCASMTIHAPKDRGARARVTWLVKQLEDSPEDLTIDAYAKNARHPISVRLGEVREDRLLLLDDRHQKPTRFQVVQRAPMGTARKKGRTRSRGFVDSILDLTTSFYESVVQNIVPWQPPAPKIKHVEAEPSIDPNAPVSRLPARIMDLPTGF